MGRGWAAETIYGALIVVSFLYVNLKMHAKHLEGGDRIVLVANSGHHIYIPLVS
jgi:hypothetical protein